MPLAVYSSRRLRRRLAFGRIHRRDRLLRWKFFVCHARCFELRKVLRILLRANSAPNHLVVLNISTSRPHFLDSTLDPTIIICINDGRPTQIRCFHAHENGHISPGLDWVPHRRERRLRRRTRRLRRRTSRREPSNPQRPTPGEPNAGVSTAGNPNFHLQLHPRSPIANPFFALGGNLLVSFSFASCALDC